MTDNTGGGAGKLTQGAAPTGTDPKIPTAQPSVDKKVVNVSQGSNTNGERDAKNSQAATIRANQDRAQLETNPAKAARIAAEVVDHSASKMSMGGVTKVLREEGKDRPPEKPTDVVQQGGGGAIPSTGLPR